MDETVADAAVSVLQRIQTDRARTETHLEEDWEQNIQNILREVLERPGLDSALAGAAAQLKREDLIDSCDKAAQFFTEMTSLGF